MTTPFNDTDSLDLKLLSEVKQQISVAEQRREEQIYIIAGLPEGTEARAFAYHLLLEMEKTLTLSRAQQTLIQNLLG